MKKSFWGVGAGLLLAAGLAQAVEVRPLVGFGLTLGGDTVGSGTYQQSGDTVKIHAGGLIAFNAGVEAQFTDLVSAQLIYGYHFDRANGDNGSMRISRMPLELLGHFRLNNSFRLGGGLRYISGAKIRASGALSYIPNEDFKPSTGLVIEGEFLPAGSSLGIKVRAVSEKYASKTFPGWNDVDGSHVGAYMVFYFKN